MDLNVKEKCEAPNYTQYSPKILNLNLAIWTQGPTIISGRGEMKTY